MIDTCKEARDRLPRSISALLSGEIRTGQKHFGFRDRGTFEHIGKCREAPCSAIRAALQHAADSAIKE
ncbi:MAG: hypothetical protein A2806_04320 [Candidatus Terrybacteria bacterium RIFCSPHIGHO2_01_FULL_48_17]|uniref:Uncharacterized protein n=1 Tax=Candidatus Terrybacteria bacterium RIFCSPHIGHO2_01_FULL_48_17 TaxID=1802362 RepID=A0A1G2PMN1_9BACT|nr:MAG: hypothetical protein A2806_04320 [Candidatus Terrybacteria bacterium RIFCSPHIGHO2_01_FULL_48_17]OHA52874.1 MAG: hypothetical protein A3A30_03195 [Candidatus Terrybacteria bacterium RIFCSPLOWO2_01_FULL_48_14]